MNCIVKRQNSEGRDLRAGSYFNNFIEESRPSPAPILDWHRLRTEQGGIHSSDVQIESRQALQHFFNGSDGTISLTLDTGNLLANLQTHEAIADELS